MSEKMIKKMIADTFLEVADALETGSYGKVPVIGLAAEDSEHGRETLLEGVRLAEAKGCKVLLIEGDDVHGQMEKLLDSGAIAGAVTMHYPFPIGVSTVGRVVTPGVGREMFLATTTGTSDTDRVSALVKNAIYGIISAKACGIAEPTVGIANIDGARQAEKALLALKEGGYDIHFAESARADGGIVMRGNDLLMGTSHVMVMDPLTGNLFMKVFSAFTTGGNYEATGYGYGPGIGEGFSRLVLILSRASGAPVIAGAIEYAATLAKNNWQNIAAAEFDKAKKAGLDKVLASLKVSKKSSGEGTGSQSGDSGAASAGPAVAPPKEVVTEQISGIEVMDLEDAVEALWRENIYAESGMGCTGPIVMISTANLAKAGEILKAKGYI